MKFFSAIKTLFLALKKTKDIRDTNTNEEIEDEGFEEIQEPVYENPKKNQKKQPPKVHGVRKKFTVIILAGFVVFYLISFIFGNMKNTDQNNSNISGMIGKDTPRQNDTVNQFPNKYGPSIFNDPQPDPSNEKSNPLPDNPGIRENQREQQTNQNYNGSYNYQTPPVNDYQGFSGYYPPQYTEPKTIEIFEQKNISNVDEDYKRSPIGFKTGSGSGTATKAPEDQVNPDGQTDVQSNIKSTVNSATAPISYVQPQKYTLQQGAIIPVTLLTGINSDLPGQIIAQVRENVYDSVSGNSLLIPQGARIIGKVEGGATGAGQERIGVSWQRLLFPNGVSVDLGSMAGVDTSGYAGLKDKVDNHTGKIIGSTLISSLLAAGAQIAAGNTGDTSTQSASQMAVSGAASSLMNAGTKLIERNMNINPTIKIRPGLQFNVFVDKDVVLKPYR